MTKYGIPPRLLAHEDDPVLPLESGEDDHRDQSSCDEELEELLKDLDAITGNAQVPPALEDKQPNASMFSSTCRRNQASDDPSDDKPPKAARRQPPPSPLKGPRPPQNSSPARHQHMAEMCSHQVC